MSELRPNGLAAALDRAQKVADRIANATEAVNKRLREVQSTLVGLRLGVRGVVELALPGDEPDWCRYLVFGKINGDWLLFVESGPDGPDDRRNDWTITPLLNASRESRLAAVDVLPFLVEDMVGAAESAAAESERKAKALDEFLATTRGADRFDVVSADGLIKVTSNLPPDVAKSIELSERSGHGQTSLAEMFGGEKASSDRPGQRPMAEMFGGANESPDRPGQGHSLKALAGAKKRRVIP